jgi:nitrate reductase gamma subunit
MGVFYSFLATVAIVLCVSIGVLGLGWISLFTIVIPYAAAGLFIVGLIYRVLKWGSSPVPFHIPTTSGQQRSLPWIKPNNIDSPYTQGGVLARIALEVLCFRSLFWNERVELKRAYELLFKRNLYLWFGGLAFHWALLIILIRHLRFFTEPVPSFVLLIQGLDGIVQSIAPALFISNLFILGGLLYLFVRRVIYPQMRYISLPSDYLALFILLSVVFSGLLMRFFFKADLVKVKGWVMGMLSFNPVPLEGMTLLFYIHLFFISFLIAYFPFSKMIHMAGIFLSPTRNLSNHSRHQRHINPWDKPVKVHTYEEYEDEFREVMKEVHLPIEKE